MKIAQLLAENPNRNSLFTALNELPFSPPNLSPRYTDVDDDDRYYLGRKKVTTKRLLALAKILLDLKPVEFKDLDPIDFEDLCTLIIQLEKYDRLQIHEMWPEVRPGSFYLFRSPAM